MGRLDGETPNEQLSEKVILFLKEYIDKINKYNNTNIAGKFRFSLLENSSKSETKFCMLVFSGCETKFDLIAEYINFLKDLPNIDELENIDKIKALDEYVAKNSKQDIN